MKRWLALLVVLASAVAAIIVAQRRKAEAPVGAQAVLSAIADSERGATRIPARLTRMPDEDEIRYGNEMAGRWHARTSVDAAVEAYVSRVGSRLGAFAHRKLPYRFHYIGDAGFINAFAVPGGHVFIGAGLLSFMDSEDELASVLAHEIEHIDHYHAAERLQTRVTLQKLPAGGALAAIPIELFQAGYAKEQESEADVDGVNLLWLAGYAPVGALRMFEKFEKYGPATPTRKAASPAGEVLHIAGDLLAGYFRSHPLAREREQAIRALINDKGWPARAERSLELDCSAGREQLSTLRRRSRPANPQKPAPPPCVVPGMLRRDTGR